MKRLFLLILFVFGICVTIEAQTKDVRASIDSLIKEITLRQDDTNKVKLINRLAFLYTPIGGKRISRDSAVMYGQQALVISERLQWEKGIANSYYVIGFGTRGQEKRKEVLAYFHKAQSIAELIDERLLFMSVTYQIGRVYEGTGQHYTAIDEYKKILTMLGTDKGYEVSKSRTLNRIGTNYRSAGDNPQALKYYLEALGIAQEQESKSEVAIALMNVANMYARLENYSMSNMQLKKALAIMKEISDINGQLQVYRGLTGNAIAQKEYTNALTYNQIALNVLDSFKKNSNKQIALQTIGRIYTHQKKYEEAKRYYLMSMELAKKSNKASRITNVALNISDLHIAMISDATGASKEAAKRKYLPKTISFLNATITKEKKVGRRISLQNNYLRLSKAYKLYGNYQASLVAYEQHILYKDSVYGMGNTEKMANLFLRNEYEKEQLTDSLKNDEMHKLAEVKLQRQKVYSFSGVAVVIVLLILSIFIAKERKKSDKLLLNILPEEVAKELKQKGETNAKTFDEVTVIFTDFVAFTKAGERMSSQELVAELNNCFKAFDGIMGKYGIEKIKTIGDAYLAVCGLPTTDNNHAKKTVLAAREIKDFMQKRYDDLGDKTFEIRIGIHSGSVVAGIVGVKKFAYDIWGDTVNTAARMEQNSEPGKINISQTTYELVKDKHRCTYRGEHEAKNKGKLKMYFVEV